MNPDITYLFMSIDLLPNFADRVKARKELIGLLQERDDLVAALESLVSKDGFANPHTGLTIRETYVRTIRPGRP